MNATDDHAALVAEARAAADRLFQVLGNSYTVTIDEREVAIRAGNVLDRLATALTTPGGDGEPFDPHFMSAREKINALTTPDQVHTGDGSCEVCGCAPVYSCGICEACHEEKFREPTLTTPDPDNDPKLRMDREGLHAGTAGPDGMAPRDGEPLRSGQREQLIDQARTLHAKAMNASDLADEGAWVARQGWHEPPGHSYWSVTATRSPKRKDVEPFIVQKALTQDPNVAAMLTFVSTALPQLCDFAEQNASPPPTLSREAVARIIDPEGMTRPYELEGWPKDTDAPMTTPTPLERLAEIAREDRRDGEDAFYSHEGEKLIDWAIARIAELEEAQAQLAAVLDEIAASEQHGDDADDPDCPICKMHAALRTALEGKPHE